MSEVEEVLAYLSDHPTASSILAAVHQVKSNAGSLKGKKWKDIDQDRFEAEMSSVPQILGQMPEGLDDGFRESIQLAEKLKEALKKKAN